MEFYLRALIHPCAKSCAILKLLTGDRSPETTARSVSKLIPTGLPKQIDRIF
jgi:hypothetical protein